MRISGIICDPEKDQSAQLLEIEPFGLHALIPDQLYEYKISLKNLSDEELSLQLISNYPEYIDVELPKTPIKPGKSKDIKVKIINSEEYKSAGFEKSFTIELSDSLNTHYTIPVVYSKSGPKPIPKVPHQRVYPNSANQSGFKTNSGNEIQEIKAGTHSK